MVLFTNGSSGGLSDVVLRLFTGPTVSSNLLGTKKQAAPTRPAAPPVTQV